MKNKWKWLLIILFGVFFIKNIVHYGIIVAHNHDFNQLFLFSFATVMFGYAYYSLSKSFLDGNY